MFAHDHRRKHHRALTAISMVNLAATPGLTIAVAVDLTFNQELLSAASALSVSTALADLGLSDTEIPLRAGPQIGLTLEAQLSMPLALAATPAMTLSATATLVASVAIQASAEMHISSQARLNLDNALAGNPVLQLQAVVHANPVILAASLEIAFTAMVNANALGLNTNGIIRVSRQAANLSAYLALRATPTLALGKQAYVRGSPIFTSNTSPVGQIWAKKNVGPYPQIDNDYAALSMSSYVDSQDNGYAPWMMSDGVTNNPNLFWMGTRGQQMNTIFLDVGIAIKPVRFHLQQGTVFGFPYFIQAFKLLGTNALNGSDTWHQLYASPFFYPPNDGSPTIVTFPQPATAYRYLCLQPFAIGGSYSYYGLAIYDMFFDIATTLAELTV